MISKGIREGDAAAMTELLAVMTRRRGNLRATAAELSIGRKTLYRILDRENLWHDVARCRGLPSEPQWLTETRLAFGDLTDEL